MVKPTTPAGIIQQSDFDTYANDWLNTISDASKAKELRDCFRYKGVKQNINFVKFSALQIAQLVSTVGASNIKARFLIVRDNKTDVYPAGYPHFALALFATDNLNGRLSAYYVSSFYWLLQDAAEPAQTQGEATDAPTGLPAEFTSGQLPDALATYWQQNWSPAGEDPDATQDMFDSTYGYLRGYTFDVNDFVMPLASIPANKSISTAKPIRINFGLHQYYPATTDTQSLNSTFGLMVSYTGTPKLKAAGLEKHASADKVVTATNPGSKFGDGDDADVFYDLAHPCPPTC
jgi:hypothetical protein